MAVSLTRSRRGSMGVMGVTILRNASVLDPEPGELAEGQSVVIEGGRIADVGPGLTGPDDAVVLEVAGQTVMPGLIDAHTHPAIVDTDVFAMAEWPPSYVAARASRALEGMLARGFTTIRDVGGGDVGLAKAVEDGYFVGPRIRFGGKQLSQTGGAGDWRAPSRRVYDDNYYSPAIGVICDGVPEVRRAVREEVRRGAHHIKVYLSGAVDSPSDREVTGWTPRSSPWRNCARSWRRPRRPISTSPVTRTRPGRSTAAWSAACAASSTAT